jgi:CheY-like chemotaxis protein
MQGCLLHIDDDENDRFLLKRAADQAGIHLPVVSLDAAPRALDYLLGLDGYADRLHHPVPCLVLLDLKMPGMNGFELVERMRKHEHLQKIPVIMLSSSNLPGDTAHALRLGANAFVSKPSSMPDLVRLLKAIDGFWLQFHEFESETDCRAPRRLVNV